MTWACFQAGSSPLPVILTGPSVQRHSKEGGGGVNAGGASFGLSPRAVNAIRPRTVRTPASEAERVSDMKTSSELGFVWRRITEPPPNRRHDLCRVIGRKTLGKD